MTPYPGIFSGGFSGGSRIRCQMDFGGGFWRWILKFGGGCQDPLPDPLPNELWRWILFFGGGSVHLAVDLAVDFPFSGGFGGGYSL